MLTSLNSCHIQVRRAGAVLFADLNASTTPPAAFTGLRGTLGTFLTELELMVQWIYMYITDAHTHSIAHSQYDNNLESLLYRSFT